MNKWIVRAAILTGLLGFAGAIYILITLFIGNNTPNSILTKPDSTIETKDTTPAKPAKKAEIRNEKPIIIPKDPIPDKLPESIVKSLEKPKPKTTQETPAPKPLKVEEKDDPAERWKTVGENKTLNQVELDAVMTQLDDEIFKTKTKSNCIKLVVFKYGNNDMAVSQIAAYIRRERYDISSKETTLNHLNGVRVNATGKCIVMTIGTF